MRTCFPKVYLVLGALCFVLLLSALVIGPDMDAADTQPCSDKSAGAPAGNERSASSSVYAPIANAAIEPAAFPGAVTEKQSPARHAGDWALISLFILPCALINLREERKEKTQTLTGQKKNRSPPVSMASASY